MTIISSRFERRKKHEKVEKVTLLIADIKVCHSTFTLCLEFCSNIHARRSDDNNLSTHAYNKLNRRVPSATECAQTN